MSAALAASAASAASAARPLPPLLARRLPALPEIELQLLSPALDLAAPGAAHAEAPPYWGFAWASGLALARHLLDHPETVRGRRVLDLGSGSGVVAIAAARAGARSVQACDNDAAARAATQRNARRNGVAIAGVACLAGADAFDVLLAADVLYEGPLLAQLCEAVARGFPVLLADPLRGGRTPPAPFAPLAFHPVRTQPDLEETPAGAVVYAAGLAAAPAARLRRRAGAST